MIATNQRLLWRLLAVLAALAIVAAACGSDDDSGDSAADSDSDGATGGAVDCEGLPDEINMAFQAIPNGDAIVKAQGYLEEELGDCTTVNWLTFDSGGSVNEAMQAGSVDIGLAGSSPVTLGLSNGFTYEVPYIFDVIGENEALIVTADSGISSLEDLVDKTIGVPFASTTHYSLLGVLGTAGVDPNDVNIVNMEPAEALAAFESGSIDGSYVWVPVLSDMKNMGGEVIIHSLEAADLGFPTFDLAVVRTEFSDQYPNAVARWLLAQDRAIKLFNDDPDTAAEIAAGELGMDVADAREAMGQLGLLTIDEQLDAAWLGTADSPGSMGGFLESAGIFLEGQGNIPAALSLAEYQGGIDPQFMELAQELAG